MNKTCARCEKTVYPTEELKCLDKVWHKGCFKCQECGMTLNMRTYKGYGKLPYCEAHVPKAKHTTMAETPELKRIAENTKIQSNVKYHADFEKSKGKFTQVADDPETLRIKANTKIISNVAYHGDLEKKAQMERQRQINENGEIVDAHTDYHQQIENYATEMLPPTSVPSLPPKNHYQTPQTHQTHQNQYQNRQYKAEHSQYKSETQYAPDNYQNKQDPHQYKQDPLLYNQDPHQYKQDQHQYKQDQHQYKQDPHQYKQDQTYQTHHQYKQDQTQQYKPEQTQYQQQQQYRSEQQYSEQYYRQQQQKYDEYYNQYPKYEDPNYGYNYQQGYGQQKIGRIQDYDPLTDGPRAIPNTQRSSATLIYNSTSDKRGAHQSAPSQQKQIGRVTDLDPLADDAPRSNHQPQNQRVYVAMYDYEANDSDEVSFREGDLISLVSAVDEGWMTGQVLRTGRTGMLPANYVELKQ